MIRVRCQYCNREFDVQPSVAKLGSSGRFCSTSCVARAQTLIPLTADYVPNSRKKLCICQRCGKEFYIPISKIKDGRGHYCSTACFYNSRRKNKIDPKRKCQICGGAILRRNEKYCSTECYWAAHRTIEICGQCGKEFEKQKSDPVKFCSQACLIQSGQFAPLWDTSFFNELHPDTAYIIGFIIADGHLSSSRNCIEIGQKDPSILYKISDVLECKIEPYCNHSNNGVFTLSFCSEEAHQVLTMKYGVPAGKKSHRVSIPDIIADSGDEILPHFLRGLFDGDGSISKSFAYYSVSYQLILELAEILKTRARARKEPLIRWNQGEKLRKDGTLTGCWMLSYGIIDSAIIGKYIYGPSMDAYGSTLYLERKKKRFEKICTDYRDQGWLEEQYLAKQKTVQEIADIANIEIGRITYHLREFGLKPHRFHPVKHKRLTRIHKLACYDEVILLKQKGTSDEKIAEFIQGQGESLDIQLSSLKMSVYRHFKHEFDLNPHQFHWAKHQLHNRNRIDKLACYDKVVSLKQNGASSGEIAKFIQEQGESLDIKLSSLRVSVFRHFKKHPVPQL